MYPMAKVEKQKAYQICLLSAGLFQENINVKALVDGFMVANNLYTYFVRSVQSLKLFLYPEV